MSPDITKAPIRAKFYCAIHGATNHVLGLTDRMFCIECLNSLAHKVLPPVTRSFEPRK